jgi:hypothetical protein
MNKIKCQNILKCSRNTGTSCSSCYSYKIITKGKMTRNFMKCWSNHLDRQSKIFYRYRIQPKKFFCKLYPSLQEIIALSKKVWKSHIQSKGIEVFDCLCFLTILSGTLSLQPSFLVLFYFNYFSDKVSHFCPVLTTYLQPLHSKYERHAPPHQAYLLRWSLTNFLPMLACDPPDLHFLHR